MGTDKQTGGITSFFGPSMRASGAQESRALNAPVYSGRGAGIKSAKDLAAASALNMKGPKGPLKRGAAYPKTTIFGGK